jgi:hypothetical protein
MDIGTAVTRYNHLVEFTQRIMKAGTDYGAVPGTSKPTLLKPGAEKLSTFFGLSPRYEIVKQVEQWDADEPFFYYWFKCSLYHGDRYVGSADGSCNSRESRYRYRWVDESDVPAHLSPSGLRKRGGKASEPKFAVERGETQGKYGKPEDYWQAFRNAIEAGTAKTGERTTKDGRVMQTWEIDRTVYRVPNEDIFSQVNTILKMAQKRALVAAVLVCVNASEFFTQDLEDLDIIDVPVTVVETKPVEAEPKAPPANAAAIDDASELAEAKQESESESVQPEPPEPPEPPTAKRSWPSETVQAIVEAEIAAPAKHAVRMLNLSDELSTTDEVDVILWWARRYRDFRDQGETPAGAAHLADVELRVELQEGNL